MDNTTLLINKADISSCRLAQVPLVKAQSVFEIKELAFTANNVTYALCGESLRCGTFILIQETEGILPAWGYVTGVYRTWRVCLA